MARKKKKNISQKAIITEYFIANPNREIAHPEIVDWATSEYLKRTGRIFRDPDRMIRSLSQKGLLVKIKDGLYMYDPEMESIRELEDFTPKQKKEILVRDGYQCVICGRGEKDGITLHIDHIKAKDHGGEASILNGQVLCAPHNFLKKNTKQTETGKKMYIRLYDLAKSEENEELLKFCTEILEVYERNGINGHIEWDK